MRLLKLAVIGFFALVAVVAGLFVAALVVVAGFLTAVARQLTGRQPRAAPHRSGPRSGRRQMKTIDAVDVTVTDVETQGREPVTPKIERV